MYIYIYIYIYITKYKKHVINVVVSPCADPVGTVSIRASSNSPSTRMRSTSWKSPKNKNSRSKLPHCITLYHIVSHCHDTSHKVCGYANKYRRFKTLERYTASWAPFRALRVQTSGNLDRSKIIRASLVHKGAQSTGSTSSSFVSNWADLLHTVSTPGHISPEMLFLAAKRCHVVPWPSFRHVSFSGRGGRWLGLSCHLFCSGWLQIQRFLPDSWTSRLLKEFHMLSSSDLVIAPLLRTGYTCDLKTPSQFYAEPPLPVWLAYLAWYW